MSSINENTIRSHRIHSRSATRAQERRRNNPTAIARRARTLERQRKSKKKGKKHNS